MSEPISDQDELALRISEARLKEAEALSHVGHWEEDHRTGTVWWSEELYRIHGRDPAGPPPDLAAFLAELHPDDRARVSTFYAHHLQGDLHRSTKTYRIIVPGVGIRHVRTVIVTERDAEGRPVRTFGTDQDITEQAMGEDAQEYLAYLREAEELLLSRILMEKTADSLYIIDPGTRRIIDVNETACLQLGYTRDEMRGMNLETVDPDVNPDMWDRHVAETRAAPGGLTFETGHRRKDGARFPVEMQVRHVHFGDRTFLVGSARDCSARKAAEAALRQATQDYQNLFEMATDPILIFEPDTEIILEANQSACRIYGFDHDELVGLDLKTLTKDVPTGSSQIKALMTSGHFHNFETIQLNKSGEEIPFLINSSVITYRGRKAILSLNRDNTEHKRAEEERAALQAQLSQAQKMESLGTLAGGVAHDMNNVLGAILSLATAHLASLPKDSPLHRSLATIRDAATRGGDMVKRLLAFSRQTPSARQALNLNVLLQEGARLLERTTLANVHLNMDLAPDLQAILGDGSALTHALMNLCVNAVDAMGDNGTLTFRTHNLGVGQVEVTVEDNGSGMTKDVLAQAMNPFFTTKAVGKGTGLGLSMVFATVKANEGTLDIQSEPGRGTRVRMTFPAIIPQDQGPGQETEVSQDVKGHALHVLVVDDDELMQVSTRMLVEVLGHTVTLAATGEAALAALEQGLRPDVVILDMNMPGLGGKGTLPRLRGLCPTVPVLLATGRADQEALDLVASQPLVVLLSKPFSFEDLRRHLKQTGRSGS
jgi:PAS domain S-box-containing protein